MTRLCLGLLVVGASASSISAAENSETDYTLFVGVDLFLDHEDEQVPIRKLERKRAQLDNPNRTAIKLDESVGFQWKRATKVSGTLVAISDLKTERVYSPRNDPKMGALKAQSTLQSFLSERVSVAQAAVARSESQAGFAAAAAANPFNSTGQGFDQSAIGIVAAADADLDIAAMDMGILNNLSLTDGNGYTNGEEASFDALELSFNVSSPFPVSNAFAVVFAQVKLNDIETNISFHHEIGEIGPTPRRIRATKLGFPPGYEISETKVHLFSHGEEIATNLSEKRYGLTDTQAREFVSIGHMASHKRDTVPAQPVWALAPNELFAAEDAPQFDFSVAVDVDNSGRVTKWSSSNVSLPVHVQNVVQRLTFLPALEKGKPVASTVTVNPADFFKN